MYGLTIKQVLKEASVKELLRAFNSNKEYFYFDISVFNVGAMVSIKCTDTYKEINQNTWNGYDFIVENNFEIEELIIETLKAFLIEDITKFKTPQQLKRAKAIIKEYK